MAEPVQLDGSKPLWKGIRPYIEFLEAHEDEVWDAVERGDENAELITELIVYGVSSPERRAVLMVCVERYISDYHPDIALIVGGYPKSKAQP